MSNEQAIQAQTLLTEQEATKRLANELRGALHCVASEFPTLSTAGLECNLKALVDVWEAQQLAVIATEIEAL